MVTPETSSVQRARTKAPDFYELFRPSHGSRQTGRPAIANESSPSLVSSPSPAEKASLAKPRRSMLPFLGRKKPAEQTAGPSTPPAPSRKSHGGIPTNPVNTVRRSLGNGHSVLMITPSPSTFIAPPVPTIPREPPLPSKLPSMDVPSPSLGSKLAAHFTPLRSPPKSTKPVVRKSAPPPTRRPPLPSATLSPPVPDIRAPSIESQNSSIQSRSTTPRPLRTVRPSTAEDGDEEDFSDLFTLPNQMHGTEQGPRVASALSVNTSRSESPTKSGQVSPVHPITPPAPCLQFPIPPVTVGRPPLGLSENSSLRSSEDLVSLVSRRSRSPSKSTPPRAAGTPRVLVDGGSDRSPLSGGFLSQDDRHKSRHRAKSLSGSETDTSRNYDSSYSSTSARLHLFPKPPTLKSSAIPKVASGPPPSGPLPTPPISPHANASAGAGLRSVPSTPSTRLPISPRPRAITLSVTSNLPTPSQSVPKTTQPRIRNESNVILMPDATTDELRDALVLQRRKNSQLQDYITTITKRYEDDRVAMTKTIEKLERNVRKKMREIEGLRWLVIHNGAVSDIDAAANLARSSLSTQEDGDMGERGRATSPLNLAGFGALIHGCPYKDGSFDEPLSVPPTPAPRGLVITPKASTSTLEVPSDTTTSSATSSQSAISSQPLTPSTTSSLPIVPERFAGISRAERQRSKEERRATKALRRISASLASGADPTATILAPSTENLLDPSFDPKQSMDEMLEKLRPFGNND